MSPEAAEELRALRVRAYGPHADIQNDPAALDRLRELELRRKAVSSTVTNDPKTPAAQASEQPSSSVIDVVAVPQIPSRASTRSRLPLLWGASVLVAVLVAILATGLTSRAFIGLTEAGSQQADATEVARLSVDPGVDLPQFLGGAGAQAFTEFHGLRLVLAPDGYMGEYNDECLWLAMSADFENATDDSYSGQMFTGCGANVFPATVAVKVTSDMPEELRDDFPEGTALQFVLESEGPEVVVFSSARP